MPKIAIPSLLTMLEEIISIPSVSCTSAQYDMSNRGVINLLAGWLEDLNFEVEIQALENNPEKANLIACRGQGPGGIVFSGHTDTVPYNEERWQQDPFSLTERDNLFYGLGSADMKAFFPIVIEAAKEFADHDLKQPLFIIATADEESSMDGARQIAKHGAPKARYAVIGEPTGLQPIIAHKGIMMECIRITGKSGHSSNPALGNNALEGMYHVISELLRFREQLKVRYQNPLFDIDYPTLNLGHIHGGDNPNRICGHCELHFDLRPLPGMDIESLHHEINNHLQVLAAKQQLNITLTPLISGVTAFQQDSNSELVKTAEKLSGQSSNSVAYATEAPFLQSSGMDTIVLGPGSIDQAHQPNEFIAQQQIKPAIAIYENLIRKFCL